MVAVAVLATALISCNKDIGEQISPKDGETTHVVLEVLKPGNPTRAEAGTVTSHTVEFRNGYVYFVDGNDKITDVFTIVDSNPNAAQRQVVMSGSIDFAEVSGSSRNIYIFGNVPTLSFVKGNSISNVVATIVDLQTQTELATSDVSNVTLYGKTQTAIDHTGNPSTAAVTVAPIGSRIEIHKFTAVDIDGSTPTAITTYKVDGIFINNFYYKSTIAGTRTSTVTPANDKYYYGKEADGQNPAMFLEGAGIYSAANAGYIYDANNAGIGKFTLAAKEYSPNTDGKVWAYNLFAPVGGEFPHIVIRVSGFNSEVGIGNELRWMTVTKFLNVSDDSEVQTFLPGRIYQIKNFTFNEDNIDVAPEMKSVTVRVSVTLATWMENEVKPW